jgi:hypothetical protein
MTWVVGGKHLFCARAISDVQMTLTFKNGDKKYLDGVRKTHIIGANIFICFADSVRLGLKIIEDLQNSFYHRLDHALFANLPEIMRRMKRSIEYFYKKHKVEQNERVEFLVFIAPTVLFTEFGMWKLVSSKFSLIERQEPFEMLELGSGSIVAEYRDIVKRGSQGRYLVEQGEGQLSALVIPVGNVGIRSVFAEAIEYQKAGISRAMHITLLTHENLKIQKLPETPEGQFPVVAHTWAQVKDLLRKQKIVLADCYASA